MSGFTSWKSMFFLLCFVPVANMELKYQHMLSHTEIIYCFPGHLPLAIRGFLQVLKLKWQTFPFRPTNGHSIFICNLSWRSSRFPPLEIIRMCQQRNKNYLASENTETFCIHWATLIYTLHSCSKMNDFKKLLWKSTWNEGKHQVFHGHLPFLFMLEAKSFIRQLYFHPDVWICR